MASRDESFVIEQSLPRGRLDNFLRARFPAVSRGTIQRLIEQGYIRVDGEVVKAAHCPRAREWVSIHWPEAGPSLAQPEPIRLEFLFEDEDLVVVNKPAGLVVHPAAGNETGTLVNGLLYHCAGSLSGIGGIARPGIVHRLDKDTSGCLVVAKNDAAHLRLAEQFAGREVAKKYEALLCAVLLHEHGEIRVPIARHPTHRKRMAAVEGGREAWTSFRVLERFRAATHVEAHLHTGRTHQIRVHFQHLGHPLVGDDTYGRRQNARLAELADFKAARQMLHARSIEFIHPRTGRRVGIESPLPGDFIAAMQALRAT